MTKGGKSGGRDSSAPEDSVSIEISIEHTGDGDADGETPLPGAIPFHVAEPTTASVRRRVAEPEPDLPVSEGADTRPGSDDAVLPQVSGIANAARRISASLGVLDEDDPGATLETRRMPRFDTDEDDDALTPPPLMVTSPIQRFEDDLDDDALLTPPPIDRLPATATATRSASPRGAPPRRSCSRGGSSRRCLPTSAAPCSIASTRAA